MMTAEKPIAVIRKTVDENGIEIERHLYLWCDPCNECHPVPITGPKAWQWNGSLESPTVQPSIKVDGVQWGPEFSFHKRRHNIAPGSPTICHSFVRNGQWAYLGDCTHDLAAQTVPLPQLPEWICDSLNDRDVS